MKRSMVFGIVALMVAISPCGAADKKELKVGDKAPSFTLADQNGKQQSLDGLLKKGKVAIVFHRSARW